MLTFKVVDHRRAFGGSDRYSVFVPGRISSRYYLCEEYARYLAGGEPKTLTVSAEPFAGALQIQLGRRGPPGWPYPVAILKDGQAVARRVRIWTSIESLIRELFPEDPYQPFYFAFNYIRSDDEPGLP